MKKFILCIGIFFVPFFATASCIPTGATVVYVNGIFNDQKKAQDSLEDLKRKYFSRTKDTTIKFTNGYNPSHLAGSGDIVQTTAQYFGGGVSSYDLKTILLQIHPQVQTQKILLVGHSQGTFYTNEMYKYLVANGVPPEAIAVYNVATPAKVVAGGGKYLNSSGDVLLETLRGNGLAFLRANIKLVSSIEDAKSKLPGHSFSGAYLDGAADRIVGDIQSQLSNLQVSDDAPAEGEGCFSAPESSLGYKAQKTFYAVGDPVAVGVKEGTVLAYKGTTAALGAVAGAVKAGATFTAQSWQKLVGGVSPELGTPEQDKAAFVAVKAIYGSSLDLEAFAELQGSAALLAFENGPNQPAPPPVPEVQGAQSDMLQQEERAVPEPVRKYVTRGGGSGEEVTEGEQTQEVPTVPEIPGDIPTDPPDPDPEDPTEEPEEPEPVDLNAVEFGWFCEPDVAPIAEGSSYRPESSACTYISNFLPNGSTRTIYVFEGEPGSAQVVTQFRHGNQRDAILTLNGLGISESTPVGTQFFLTIFEDRPSGAVIYGDSVRFESWFTTGDPLRPINPDGIGGFEPNPDSTDPPHQNYRILRWTYGS